MTGYRYYYDSDSVGENSKELCHGTVSYKPVAVLPSNLLSQCGSLHILVDRTDELGYRIGRNTNSSLHQQYRVLRQQSSIGASQRYDQINRYKSQPHLCAWVQLQSFPLSEAFEVNFFLKEGAQFSTLLSVTITISSNVSSRRNNLHNDNEPRT